MTDANGQTSYMEYNDPLLRPTKVTAPNGQQITTEYGAGTDSTNRYVKVSSQIDATNIGGSELVEFHHPERLGTKVVTNPSATSSYEQSTLPFGTELAGEESGTVSTNQQFTSYDRSTSAGLDYAVNRTYSSGQGRFTQVDPLGMGAASTDPQSLNLYAYTKNNPVDLVDPSGLLMEMCYTYVYGKEYKFPDGTIIRIPEGTYTTCDGVGGFGGGPIGGSNTEPEPSAGAGGSPDKHPSAPPSRSNDQDKYNSCVWMRF